MGHKLDRKAIEYLGWEPVDKKTWRNGRFDETVTTRYETDVLPPGFRISRDTVAAQVTRKRLRDQGWKVIDTGKMYVAERVMEAGSSLECFGLFPIGGIEGKDECVRTAKFVIELGENEHREVFRDE